MIYLSSPQHGRLSTRPTLTTQESPCGCKGNVPCDQLRSISNWDIFGSARTSVARGYETNGTFIDACRTLSWPNCLFVHTWPAAAWTNKITPQLNWYRSVVEIYSGWLSSPSKGVLCACSCNSDYYGFGCSMRFSESGVKVLDHSID